MLGFVPQPNLQDSAIANIQSIESKITQEIPNFSLLSNIPDEIVDKYDLKTKIYPNPYL